MTPHSKSNRRPSIDDGAPGRSGDSIAEILRRRRKDAELTLQELAERCNLASSTLSKIENGQMSPTYETIIRVADGLDIDVTELFSGKPSHPVGGRRTVTRAGQGVVRSTAQYTYEMLAADLTGKQFIPLLTTIDARSLTSFPDLVRHVGEEFFYVLSGSVTLHTEHYAPTTFQAGDSCYFDSTMGHALVSTGDEAARILWICSRVIAPLEA
ncbi:putative transcriptional regulator [uncultured Pleomorphomonas sp.]|uniref:Putative transcriptional regulator n=1 Tax=uncultured Pleomorphomonas sp. TaxID=442121 RepID=A0A212LFZ6_9HYPH|nr:XRE family transcriptional regulator [uncultured Pleomorphomonas sp.]SCM76309.1 putative transcriptional regulator [uncultured Pleomorphomonas sp.]